MAANASFAAALLIGFSLLFAVMAESPYRFFEWNVTYGDIYPLGVRQQVNKFIPRLRVGLDPVFIAADLTFFVRFRVF